MGRRNGDCQMPLLYCGAILLTELHLSCCLEAVCSELPMEEIQNLYRDLLPLYLGLPDQLEEASMIRDKQLFIGRCTGWSEKKTNRSFWYLQWGTKGRGDRKKPTFFYFVAYYVVVIGQIIFLNLYNNLVNCPWFRDDENGAPGG